MKILKKLTYTIVLFLCINNKQFSVEAKNLESTKRIAEIKVAFYTHNPYYFLNDKLEPDGYYHELLEFISQELNLEYQYVFMPLEDCLEKLKTGDVDLVFGLNKTVERENNYLFTRYNIGTEEVSLYSDKNIGFESLQDLRIAYISKDESYNHIFKILSKKNIEFSKVITESSVTAEKLLSEKKVDAIVTPYNNPSVKNYHEVFRYTVGPIYIAGSLGNDDLIDEIDSLLEKNISGIRIQGIYDNYFNPDKKLRKIYFFIVPICCSALIMGLTILLKNNHYKKCIKDRKRVILNHFEENNFKLYYQPIIDARTEAIKGFEALLRLEKEEKILTPYHFLKEIEESDLMTHATLWVLRKALDDYQIIKEFNIIENKDFYISINISFKELEDTEFINSIQQIVIEQMIDPQKICLEIVERFCIHDVKKIQSVILKLKKFGFKIAIDDFGVEYSNFDLLEKVDCDVIKLDKYFIDDIETSYVRKEVFNFVSNICKYSGKIIVAEGVESLGQLNRIKQINTNNFCVQGYYYSKPKSIEELKNFKIDKTYK